MELEFFASCLPGLEQVLAGELKKLGARRVRPLGGGAAFFGDAECALGACLWSRVASRVVLVVGRVSAADAEELYAGATEVAWERIIASGATFAVHAHGTNEELRNTRFTALKVKDAIVDRFQRMGRMRPRVDSAAPRASIDIRIRKSKATLSLDLSGEALNHRSYLTPDDKKDAPLECTLAAGALLLGKWDQACLDGSALVDPACRDGIVLVEAAAIACDKAPGLDRRRWGFMGWIDFDAAIWDDLVAQAQERFNAGLQKLGVGLGDGENAARPDLSRVRFVGASNSSPLIARAREHVRRAGLRSAVSVELGDAKSMSELVARVSNTAKRTCLAAKDGHARCAPGCAVVCNIDAAARQDARAHVQSDEAAFVSACSAAQEGSCFVAVNAQDVSMRFAEGDVERSRVGAGRVEAAIECFFGKPIRAAVVDVADPAGGALHHVTVLEQASAQFASRLRKVFKERRKWAAREGVTCYRVYDADLPDYAVAIDWYTGAGDAHGNNYLHIAEYAAPASIDAERARRRFNDVLTLAPLVCGIRPDHVFSKRRIREKGGGQYRNARQRAYPTTVEEGAYRFEVDLAGRLDTGLFLDHRLTRFMIGDKAKGARFLNLFAYTGTATVHAAGGGALTTTTVDLSQTYLDWAKRNVRANGFTSASHAFVHADVMRWITNARRANQRFDLIFVDPPTFSNSKAMGKKTWDVQRDHVELLVGVVHLLAKGGQAVFSCNLRSFKPYLDKLTRYGVKIEDISLSTIPHDFERTPKIHKCYLVTKA